MSGWLVGFLFPRASVEKVRKRVAPDNSFSYFSTVASHQSTARPLKKYENELLRTTRFRTFSTDALGNKKPTNQPARQSSRQSTARPLKKYENELLQTTRFRTFSTDALGRNQPTCQPLKENELSGAIRFRTFQRPCGGLVR